MVFADLHNDFVFRRIFATHPEILRLRLERSECAKVQYVRPPESRSMTTEGFVRLVHELLWIHSTGRDGFSCIHVS